MRRKDLLLVAALTAACTLTLNDHTQAHAQPPANAQNLIAPRGGEIGFEYRGFTRKGKLTRVVRAEGGPSCSTAACRRATPSWLRDRPARVTYDSAGLLRTGSTLRPQALASDNVGASFYPGEGGGPACAAYHIWWTQYTIFVQVAWQIHNQQEVCMYGGGVQPTSLDGAPPIWTWMTNDDGTDHINELHNDATFWDWCQFQAPALGYPCPWNGQSGLHTNGWARIQNCQWTPFFPDCWGTYEPHVQIWTHADGSADYAANG
jgi:hypothetical protein